MIMNNHTVEIYKGNDFVARVNNIEHISIQQNNIILLKMDCGDVLVIYGKVVNQRHHRKSSNWINRFISAIRVRS